MTFQTQTQRDLIQRAYDHYVLQSDPEANFTLDQIHRLIWMKWMQRTGRLTEERKES